MRLALKPRASPLEFHLRVFDGLGFQIVTHSPWRSLQPNEPSVLGLCIHADVDLTPDIFDLLGHIFLNSSAVVSDSTVQDKAP